jgi:hypothetical protein
LLIDEGIKATGLVAPSDMLGTNGPNLYLSGDSAGTGGVYWQLIARNTFLYGDGLTGEIDYNSGGGPHSFSNNSFQVFTIANTGEITFDQYTTANFNGGTASDSLLTVNSFGAVRKINTALFFQDPTFSTITYSATPTWNYSTGFNKIITLTGDANLLFSNVHDGNQGTLIVIQDGIGGHALTVPDQIVTLNTGAGDTTVLGFINQGGIFYWASSVVAPTGVTSVTGTTNRITSTGGTTPVIDISASYVGQSSITTLGTVTSGSLGTGAVVRGVTMTLGSDATGDIYYRNSSGVLTRLAVGTSKQTLHGGTNPQWLDTATAALVVGTTTITSGTNGRVLYDNSGTLGEMTTTGSGTVLALATSPVLVTPTLGVATATTINGNTFTTGTYTLTGQAGKTLTFNGSITLTGTDAQTYTFPTTTATIARTDAAQTFTGVQTFSSAPVIGSITNTGLLTLPTVAGTVMQYSYSSSAATATPAGDAKVNDYVLTALNVAPTFSAPSGSLTDANILNIRIKDNGTARVLSWNGIYIASPDLPLPTTTILGKTMYLTFKYNSATPGWNLIGMVNNFGIAQIFMLSFILGGLATGLEKRIKRRRISA